MDAAFSLRRKEVVESEPALRVMVERWPALFTKDQIYLSDLFIRVILLMFLQICVFLALFEVSWCHLTLVVLKCDTGAFSKLNRIVGKNYTNALIDTVFDLSTYFDLKEACWAAVGRAFSTDKC